MFLVCELKYGNYLFFIEFYQVGPVHLYVLYLYIYICVCVCVCCRYLDVHAVAVCMPLTNHMLVFRPMINCLKMRVISQEEALVRTYFLCAHFFCRVNIQYVPLIRRRTQFCACYNCLSLHYYTILSCLTDTFNIQRDLKFKAVFHNNVSNSNGVLKNKSLALRLLKKIFLSPWSRASSPGSHLGVCGSSP